MIMPGCPHRRKDKDESYQKREIWLVIRAVRIESAKIEERREGDKTATQENTFPTKTK